MSSLGNCLGIFTDMLNAFCLSESNGKLIPKRTSGGTATKANGFAALVLKMFLSSKMLHQLPGVRVIWLSWLDIKSVTCHTLLLDSADHQKTFSNLTHQFYFKYRFSWFISPIFCLFFDIFVSFWQTWFNALEILTTALVPYIVPHIYTTCLSTYTPHTGTCIYIHMPATVNTHKSSTHCDFTNGYLQVSES